jgi:hypothetical protein
VRVEAVSTSAGALLAGVLTFGVVVLALTVYGNALHDACMTEAVHAGEAWSRAQQLAWWPPAATHCEWTASGKAPMTWTLTAWPLWPLYAAVLAAAALAMRCSATAAR